MTTDDTTPGTLQAQWTARLDDIERRFSNVARVQADGLERALVRLGDKSRECEQLKERVRMAEERASKAESKYDAQLQVSAEFDRENDRLIARVDGVTEANKEFEDRVAVLETALRKQLMEPARWQDEDIDGRAFGPVVFICQHCGSGDENADAIEHAEDCAYVAIRAALGDAAPATDDKPADPYPEDECKWCSNPTAEGDNVCEAHRKLNAIMSSKPAEPQGAEENAKLRARDDERDLMLDAAYRDADKLHAALGKAVAALRDARGEITRMATDGGGFSCTVVDDIDTVLADADGKAAGEYVRALEDEHEAVKAYRQLHKLTLDEARRWDNSETGRALDDAIAAVDARRVKPQ